nr:uncharacterized protein LOC116779088 isoform X2 [Danaus plexippus plexippus]
MKVLLISAILLQAWCNAYPKPKGVASYVYTDTDGNSGTSLARTKRRIDMTRLRSRFPFGGFPFGPSAFNVNRFGENAAFASSAIAPGYRHQSAIISPANADIPNVSLTDRYADPSDDGKFYSVSSSSFASSDNDNGKLSGFRQAETVVNDNGKITKYRVHS